MSTRRRSWFWVLAFVITLTSAVWQRMTGPTYPVRGIIALGGEQIRVRLERSHGGPGNQPVVISAADPAVAGEMAWRRFPTDDRWTVVPLARRDNDLEAFLPHQPPAGKLEYQVRLRRGEAQALFPALPAVTRFKGDVPNWLLVPHVLAMFVGMLFATRTGLAALSGTQSTRRLAWITTILLGLGGFLLGPAVQKLAFGDWWTGIPFGYDLTDNKTLIAIATWAWALWMLRRGRENRGAVFVAALVTMVVFAIPHSVWGSEIRWDQVAS